MMFDFLVFSVKRYARFLSYFSAFLAGFSFGLSPTLFLCALALSIVLGSAAAYSAQRSPRQPKKEKE